MFIHMLSEILRTKLFPPPMRPSQVDRPLLFTRLDDSLRLAQRFILISAPAGFGKSTLIAAWIKKTTLPYVWLTLDESDNDPVRFWRYLVSALQSVFPNFGADIQSALLTPQPPSSRTLIIPLINELVGLGGRVVIVLDDFHQIQNEEIIQAVVQVVDRLPSGSAVAILTRSDPPIQLARFRGSSDLCEIRAIDLRFNLEEIRTFLNEKMGLVLEKTQLVALDQRTEGWVVGLQMAALSLQGRADPEKFIAEFSGDDRYIADYLLEEVLSRQPAYVQDFLLTTSILDRINAQICNELTGRHDGQAILNLLDRENLFIIPLDNRREWFRYHHLFSSLLRQLLLESKGPIEVQELHRRLINWYAGSNQFREAARLAINIGDFEKAVDLMIGASSVMFMANELTTIRNWGLEIPSAVLKNNPTLCILLAWANHAVGHTNDCKVYLTYVEMHFNCNIDHLLSDARGVESLTAERRSTLIEACVVYTRLALDDQSPEQVETYCKRLTPYLDEKFDQELYLFNPPSNLYPPLRFIQGLAEKAQGKISAAIGSFEDALAGAQKKQNSYIIALASTQLGWMKIAQGQLLEARAAFHIMVPANHSSSTRLGFSGPGLIGLGYLDYELGHRTEAEENLQSGLALGLVFRSLEDTLPGYRYLIQLCIDGQDWQKAYQAVTDLERLIEKDADPSTHAARILRAYVDSCSGETDAAVLWLQKSSEELAKVPPYFLEHSKIVLSRILINLGRFEDAQEILVRLQKEANQQERNGNLIEILAMLACVSDELANYDQSVQALSKAIKLAESEDYLSVFTSLGMPMYRTIERNRKTIASSYTQRLLNHLKPGKASHEKHDPSGLIEPLSEREVEILQLIATGASNAEIASRLVISINTVKKHTTNIYGKLGVSTRVQAVEIARRLGYYPQ